MIKNGRTAKAQVSAGRGAAPADGGAVSADGGAAADVAVRVEELRVVRGRRAVIPGLSWTVPGGRIVGLLGPSGCGKTTLMRCLVGVQKITAGTVTVLGRPG